MTTYLTIDTETANLTTKNIVQLAAILWTDSRELAQINFLIEPEGWTIDPKAREVHGISMEDCQQWGVPIEAALYALECLTIKADVVCAHNYSFDGSVISDEFRRLERVWSVRQGYCTMSASAPYCKIPPTPAMIRAGRRHYKSPSLQEAHIWATGEGFEGGHDGLVDVEACIRVHKKLLELS